MLDAGDTIAIVFNAAMKKSTIGTTRGNTALFDVEIDKDADANSKYLVTSKNADTNDVITTFVSSGAFSDRDQTYNNSTGIWRSSSVIITLVGGGQGTENRANGFGFSIPKI